MAQERLQKALARAGVASRRAAEAMIAAGRVRVNDVVIKELGTKVDPLTDEVRVDGRIIRVQGEHDMLAAKVSRDFAGGGGFIDLRARIADRERFMDALALLHHRGQHRRRVDAPRQKRADRHIRLHVTADGIDEHRAHFARPFR